jgi:hypothetical protein
MGSRWNKDLRASLDELREYQALNAPGWFHAKEKLDALARDEEQRRSARGAGLQLSHDHSFEIEIVCGDEDEDEGEDEGEDEESDTDEEALFDGSDDGHDDDVRLTTEETGAPQAAEAAKKAAAAAQELAELGKMMEKTQLGAEATASRNEPSGSKAKDDVAMKPGVVPGGHEADVGTPAGRDLQCKHCDHKFSDERALCSHIVEAHPGAAMEAVILKLVDDRFNALAEESRTDAGKGTTEALRREFMEAREAILRETNSARAKLSQETHAARARSTQQEAQLEQKFEELRGQLIATFTRLVGLADEHLETTADQNIARLLAEVTKSLEQKAQRLREIAKSDHDRRTKEAVQSEIDALDVEDALQKVQSAARQAQKEALQAKLRN